MLTEATSIPHGQGAGETPQRCGKEEKTADGGEGAVMIPFDGAEQGDAGSDGRGGQEQQREEDGCRNLTHSPKELIIL